MMKLKFILSSGFLSLALFALSQEQVHFSQFETTPLDINPALAGVFRGDIRFNSSVRQQWASITDMYQTLYGSVDFPVAKNIIQDDFFALGISFINDMAGKTLFTTNQGYLTLAYSKSLSPKDDNYFSLGFQGGWAQRSISSSGINFENQWTGTAFDNNLPNGELTLNETSSYFDMNSGIHWFFSPNDKFKSSIGLSMSHLHNPDVNFLGLREKLYRKFSIHGICDIFIEKHKLSLLPKFYFMQQGKNRIILLGNDINFHLKGRSEITNYLHDLSIAIGTYYRFADALAPHLSMKWAGFTLDFSYDLTLSHLKDYNSGIGGPEISLTYRAGLSIGKHDRAKHSEVMFF